MSGINVIKNILFPKRCAACRALLPAVEKSNSDERVLCNTCRAEFEKEKNIRCKVCGKHYFECLCPNAYLSNHGIKHYIKLTHYHSNSANHITNKLIYKMKRTNDGYLFDFVAKQLFALIGSYIFENDIDFSEVVVTFIPRSPRAVLKYGHDHARKLAEHIASCMGKECEKLISHTEKYIEEKKLTRNQRIENAQNVLFASNSADLSGKYVFVVDDIVTSGASMAAAADILYEKNAADVIAVSVAETRYKNISR